MNKYKKDYLALQNLWNVCALRYLGSRSSMERMHIIDDFRDSLIDIKPYDKTDTEDANYKAIRSSYEKWEQEYWIPYCKTKLAEWIKYNPFESQVETKKIQELQNTKQDYNYMRFRKIMQLIQDSGIGLGQGSSSDGAWDYKDAVED